MRVGLGDISRYGWKLEDVIFLLAENTVDLDLKLSVVRVVCFGDLVDRPRENAPRVVDFGYRLWTFVA